MAEKRQVVVHVTFLKVGEINTLKECYEADVLLRSQWRVHELDIESGTKAGSISNLDLSRYWNPEIYIDNILGEPKRSSSIHVEYDANGHAYLLERRRVRGTFLETMELWEFPFDIQDLTLTVMSEKSISEVEIIEDPNELHKIYKQSFIDEQEWYLYKYIESEKCEMMKDRADPTVLRSALTVRCRSARRPAYFLWNSFSVTFLICCLSFVTFSVEHTLPQNRLQLSFTLVLTAVAFKFVVNQSLPKISYLTYLDRYIFATMVLLVSTCFWHGAQTLVNYDRVPDADWIAMVILAGSFLCYNVQFILRLIFVDRYLLVSLSCMACVSIWHGMVPIISAKYQAVGRPSDICAFYLFISGYAIYNILFASRIIFVPYRKRREMSHKEHKYIGAVKEQAQIRKSTRHRPTSVIMAVTSENGAPSKVRCMSREKSAESMNGKARHASEAGSLDDYISANPRNFSEEGSFIGEYAE